MPCIVIRDLSDEALRALTLRAATHGRSVEEEMRAILEAAARVDGDQPIGSAIFAIARGQGLSNADVEAMLRDRDVTPAEPFRFDRD